MTFEHQSKSIINGVNDNGAVPYGFRILYSSIIGSGEPVPSTSCNHHSLILVIQCLITQLLLAYNLLFPYWVIVARPVEIDDVARRSRL